MRHLLTPLLFAILLLNACKKENQHYSYGNYSGFHSGLAPTPSLPISDRLTARFNPIAPVTSPQNSLLNNLPNRTGLRFQNDSMLLHALYYSQLQQNQQAAHRLSLLRDAPTPQPWSNTLRIIQSGDATTRWLEQTGHAAIKSGYRQTRPYIREALLTASRKHALLWENLANDARSAGMVWKSGPLLRRESNLINKTWQYTQQALCRFRANPVRYMARIPIR